MSVYPNTGCHAVLALLSEGYPPLEGRSPTRYSPVCHSTCPLRGFRVRLACIRHAASVDSEPGSNSQVKFAALRSALRPRSGTTRSTRSPVELALGFEPASLRPTGLSPRLTARTRADEVRPAHVKCVGSSARSQPWPTPEPSERCPLILDGLCLHVLSSFQRTGRTGFAATHSSDEFRRRRTLSNLRQGSVRCQPLST